MDNLKWQIPLALLLHYLLNLDHIVVMGLNFRHNTHNLNLISMIEYESNGLPLWFGSAVVWMLIFILWKSYFEAWTPCHDGASCMNGIGVPLQKKFRKTFCSFIVWEHRECAIYEECVVSRYQICWDFPLVYKNKFKIFCHISQTIQAQLEVSETPVIMRVIFRGDRKDS